MHVDVPPPIVVEIAVRVARHFLKRDAEVVDLAEPEEGFLAMGEQLGERRVAVLLGEKAHLGVPDRVEQTSVPRRAPVVVGKLVVQDGGAQPAVAAVGVPRLGLVLREALGPEARQRVAEEDVADQAEVGADGAEVEDVR